MAGDTYRIRVASGLFRCGPQSLGSYFEVYDKLIARGDALVLRIEEPEPVPGPINSITHEDILLAAEILRSDPTLTLDQASEQLRTRLSTLCSTWWLKRTIRFSVRAVLMSDADCATPEEDAWQSNERFADFVSRRFPKAPTMSVAVMEALEDRKSMKAWKLKERFNLSFKVAHDLANHLLLDPQHPDGPTLHLFRYAAYMKTQFIRLRRDSPQEGENILMCLRSGSLPPRLLAETLHSIQTILFHFDDHRSIPILARLIAKDGFDEECKLSDGYPILDGPKGLEYRYWGERLAELHKFMRERPPRNKLERWMKWQSAESNAFVIAVAALVISIVVGILGLGLGSVQTWIAWGAWKNPVSNDEETTALLREIAELLRQQRGRRRA